MGQHNSFPNLQQAFADMLVDCFILGFSKLPKLGLLAFLYKRNWQ